MKKLIVKFGKIFCASLLAGIVLSMVGLGYSYNTLVVSSRIDVAEVTWKPRSLYSNMEEGFGWNVLDSNGFNNDEVYDNVDILVVGGSHIEALQMNRSESVTNKLNEMLPEYHVYNVGTMAHTLEMCGNFLENACNYFSPRYVVIDMISLDLDKNIMNAVMEEKYSYMYPEEELFSTGRPVITEMINDIPALVPLQEHLDLWYRRGTLAKIETDKNKSSQENMANTETLNQFITYIGDIAKEHETQLILLYHPANYEVDETGQISFEDEADALEIFENICEENGIVFVSTKDENIKMFNEKHVVPHGFSNTRLGEGHLNKYGHTAMANVLYETIKELED